MRVGRSRSAAAGAGAALTLSLALAACQGPGSTPAGATSPATTPASGPAAATVTHPAKAGSPAAASAPVISAPATTRPATATPQANPLQGTAAVYLSGRSGRVTAAVYDLKTGQSWALGDGRAQDEASVVKLDILETLLAQHQGGALSPADQSLARAMIEDSDNDSATSLWDAAGGADGLTAYGTQAGLQHTIPSPCVNCAGFPWPGWGLTTTVPSDQLTLLRQLVAPGARPLLSRSQRSYALGLLENVTADQRWGVSGGVPAGVTVALKNGWLPLDSASTDWQVNSVGWISGQGRDYLLAVLSTGNPTEQYGIDTISALSAQVWSALG